MEEWGVVEGLNMVRGRRLQVHKGALDGDSGRRDRFQVEMGKEHDGNPSQTVGHLDFSQSWGPCSAAKKRAACGAC